MKFTKLFGEGCKELGMGVKPTRDGVEITPTVESMDKLIAFMGGIPAEPEASRGEQGDSDTVSKHSVSSPRDEVC